MDQAHPSPARDTAGRMLLDTEVPATLDEVSRLCAELSALAVAGGGTTWAAEIDLGMMEVLTNVVRHGYGDTGQGRIAMTCQATPAQWQLSVHDHGSPIPADLLAQADGSVFDFDPDDLDNIPEGGMGLALIRGCFDQLDYVADNAGNHLHLVKLLPPLTD